MRVMITGITGLIGSHLAEHLLTLGGVEVFGFKRWRSQTDNIAAFGKSISLVEGDIGDPYSVQRALECSRPDLIFHFAAQSYPSESWDAPEATLHTNVIGTVHLLNGVRKITPAARVLIACSSAQYGFISPDEVPVTENHRLQPLSPYGVSKVTQELLGLQYHLCFGMNVYLARFFNQVGPRQGDRCSIQTFAKQIAETEKTGGQGTVYHGNLSPRRDFLDARDGARAALLLLERGQPGKPYNICSGQARQIEAILNELISLSPASIGAEVDPPRLRPADEPILVGDHSCLSRDTGWEPEIPFTKTLSDVLQYWRERV